jgi:hypothetical protein
MGKQRRRKPQRKRQQKRQPVVERRSRLPIVSVAALTIIAAVVVVFIVRSRAPSSTPAAPSSHVASRDGRPVDGVTCDRGEQLVYHIHLHLALYRNGSEIPVPQEIGIPGGENNAACFYWIHVHNFAPGVLHVESPKRKIYPLGAFFDIWRVTQKDAVPQGANFVGQLEAAARNHDVTVFLNGRRWSKGYRAVPLIEHAVIVVEIGKPVVKPKPYNGWSQVD